MKLLFFLLPGPAGSIESSMRCSESAVDVEEGGEAAIAWRFLLAAAEGRWGGETEVILVGGESGGPTPLPLLSL